MPNSQALASPARLAALHKTGLLETPEEERFDSFTRLAAQILGVPTVIITLVESKRQYFKSATCVNGSASPGWNPLEASFCQDVVATGNRLVVSDVQTEPDLSQRGIQVRAYAGFLESSAQPYPRYAVKPIRRSDLPRRWKPLPALGFLNGKLG